MSQTIIFQSCRDGVKLPGFNQYCRELMCLAPGHNRVPLVGIKHKTSPFGVPHSTTKPSRSLCDIINLFFAGKLVAIKALHGLY